MSRLKDIEYKEFSLNLNTSYNNIPLKGHLELTYNCNLACLHCYTSCYNNPDEKSKEISFGEICSILDQISESGCLWLTFTGGEPLSRDDFMDIYLYAKKRGFIITLFTNGTLITKEISDLFSQYPPFSIEITLNSIKRKTYEAISQVSGSFKGCMEGIELILKRGLPLRLKTQLTVLNYSELEDIITYAKAIGVEHNVDPIIYPRLDGNLWPYKYRISKDRFIKINNKEGKLTQPPDINRKLPSRDYVISCANGISSFFIDPYGNTVFCNLIRKPFFRIKEKGFSDCFKELYSSVRSLRYTTDSKCKSCTDIYNCYRCPGISLLEYNDLEVPAGFYCLDNN